MVDKIAQIVYGIIFSVPLIFAILYLVALLFKKYKCSRKKKYMKKIIIAFVLLMALFMLYFVVIRFMFPSISIPKYLETFGIVLFFLSFGTIGGVIFGFAKLGEVGFSPRSVADEIYNLFSKKSGRNVQDSGSEKEKES